MRRRYLEQVQELTIPISWMVINGITICSLHRVLVDNKIEMET